MLEAQRLEKARGIAQALSEKWETQSGLKSPLALFLAGFQGAGKSSLLQRLRAPLELEVISLDVIRHKLFEAQIPVSEDFVEIVRLSSEELIRKAVTEGRSFGVDTNTYSSRLRRYRSIIAESGVFDYRVRTIFLDAPIPVLERRILSRASTPGVYRGTVKDFYESLETHGQLDKKAYDFYYDTSKTDLDTIARQVQSSLTV